jgi:hypothetical protein
MKRIFVFLSVVALTASVTHAQNLLLNGDFNLPNSISAPADWIIWSYGSGYANHEILSSSSLIDMSHGTVHPNNTGNYDSTYQMSIGGLDTSSGAGVNQTVAATAGLDYTLSVDAGAQGWWLPTGQIRLFFLDGSNTQLGETQINTTDGIHSPDQYDIGVAYQNWSFSAIAPVGTTQAEVEFAGYGGGTTWFDNASLTVQTVPEPRSTAMIAIGFALLALFQFRRGVRCA